MPDAALDQYPRYLKALAIRAERALRDPARDQQRMLDLSAFTRALTDAAQSGIAHHDDWQTFRWDLEELRVSVHAQELAQRGGVSAKKLAAQLVRLHQD